MIDLVNSINRNNSDFIGTGQRSTKTAEKPFAINDPDKKCPYSCLAKDGVIEYNGVTFACDYKHNCITLGDVTSNPKKVLNIGLSGGGCLKVNVDNLDDLAKASGMFSPADLNAIMRAIQTYKHCTSKLNEIEEEENESPEETAGADEQADSVRETSKEQLGMYNEKLYQKLLSNDAIMNAEVDIKLDYEERLSDEEFERRIELLFEDMEKVV